MLRRYLRVKEHKQHYAVVLPGGALQQLRRTSREQQDQRLFRNMAQNRTMLNSNT